MNDDIQNLKLVSIIRITNRKLIKEEIQQLRQIALSLKPIILDLQTNRLWKRFRYSKPGTNSHRSCSIKKKMFLEILQNSRENTCRPRASTLLKKGIWHRFFPVNFANFYRPPPGDCFWHGKVNNVFWQVENKKLYTPCFVSWISFRFMYASFDLWIILKVMQRNGKVVSGTTCISIQDVRAWIIKSPGIKIKS